MKCPKCGNSGEPYNWGYAGPSMPHGRPPVVHRIGYCHGRSDDRECSLDPAVTTGEHLDTRCGDCGYSWATPCMDAKP